MPSSLPSKKDFEAMLNAKAWKDAKFRQKLLKDPKAALTEMGVEVPNDVKVSVTEDTQNAVTFVLFPTPAKAGEMEEEELRKVVGGARYDVGSAGKLRYEPEKWA